MYSIPSALPNLLLNKNPPPPRPPPKLSVAVHCIAASYRQNHATFENGCDGRIEMGCGSGEHLCACSAIVMALLVPTARHGQRPHWLCCRLAFECERPGTTSCLNMGTIGFLPFRNPRSHPARFQSLLGANDNAAVQAVNYKSLDCCGKQGRNSFFWLEWLRVLSTNPCYAYD